MTYKELLNHLKALDPSVKSVELFLRKYFTDEGVGFADIDLIADTLALNLLTTAQVTQGQFAWNADEETADLGLNGAVLQLGQEVHYHVRNDSGADITDGTPIMYNSADGTIGNSGRIKVVEMDGTDPANSKFFMGIATESIPDGEDGKITHFGKIRGINTTGSTLTTPEEWADGDILFVSPTVVGELTKTMPSSPDMALPVAIVIHAHSSGTLFVRATQHDEQTAWGDRANGHYTEIQSDGSVVSYGDATMYLDELAPLVGQRLEAPGSAIVQNNAESSLTFKTNAALTDYVSLTFQFNHDWDISDVLPHVHWWQTTSNTPNWLIQYRWQLNGDAKTTAWTSLKWQSNAFSYTSGTLNQISSFGAVSPPVGANVSALLQIRLIRDNANTSTLFAGADPVAADQDAVSFDIHKRVNSFGSRQEYIK